MVGVLFIPELIPPRAGAMASLRPRFSLPAAARQPILIAAPVLIAVWQTAIGRELEGKVLGVLGLGNIGKQIARISLAFGMKVIAWSENMRREIAEAEGATFVTKSELFRQADIVTAHLVLSKRTRGLVGAAELQLMKPTARLVNTSRGEIVDEGALIDALQSRTIAGAAIDVFDDEPLPEQHPFRRLDNVLATPHIGYVAEDLYGTFYGDAAASITAWLNDQSGGTT